MKEIKPLERAIEILGGQERLAEKLDVTTQAVYKWRRSRVPAERVLAVEEAVAGAVTRHQLRPDIYPLEPVA